MLKNNDGIYIVGDSLKFDNSKYPNDKYDRELYIPKGYILPSGEMLTKEYARFHEDMAKKFIEEMIDGENGTRIRNCVPEKCSSCCSI